MKLEEIVPPFDLCKKIPAGEFEDSALLYVVRHGWHRGVFNDVMVRQDLLNWSDTENYPAPTATEILKVLWNDYQKPTVYFRNIWHATVVNDYGDEITAVDNENAANAALKLWLELKGVEE